MTITVTIPLWVLWLLGGAVLGGGIVYLLIRAAMYEAWRNIW